MKVERNIIDVIFPNHWEHWKMGLITLEGEIVGRGEVFIVSTNIGEKLYLKINTVLQREKKTIYELTFNWIMKHKPELLI